MTGRRWLIAVAVVWAAALLVGGVVSSRTDPATAREHSPLDQGRRTLDGAVTAVLAAAGSGVTAEVAGYELATGCRLTVSRDGATLERAVLLTVPAGQEPALLDRMAERLPAGWGARHFEASGRLIADAGDFVSVRAEPAGPGRVEVRMSTGCRPGTVTGLAPAR
jgi:hypothetical protein